MERPLTRALAAVVTAVIAMGIGHGEATSQPVDAPVFDDFSRVDFYTPVVISSNRVIGLGGAFISIAEGADGHLVNPASYAVRFGYTADDWFDWDWTFGFLTLPSDDSTKVDLSEVEAAYGELQFASGGIDFKLGRHGFGIHVETQNYAIDGTLEDARYSYLQNLGQVAYAYAFGNGDLTLGGAINFADAQFTETDAEEPLITISGAGIQLGVLYGPCNSPYRIGATYRSPIAARDVAEGDDEDLVGGLVPHELAVPWEVGVGASYMFGPRPYNVCPSFGEYDDDNDALYTRYFERQWSRRYFLVSADLVLIGPNQDAIGIQSFLQREFERAGQTVSVSPRAGVETEIVPDLLVLRLGGYYEPSRYDHRAGRPHFTGGGALNLFHLFWQWKATASVDVAESYLNVGVGLGFWH